MAPRNSQGDIHSIDRTPEYEEFIEKLKQYHEKRGTILDPEPKIGPCHIDLLKLFNHVIQHGGYDKISAEKLAWRKVTEELNIPAGNIAQTSFQIKTVFYKNLAAYEISTIHKKEPPPKELLEDQSAKGGSLLTRSWENNPFKTQLADTATDQSGDESTPVRERPTNSQISSVRASRGLREAPPQRVLFQPETSTPRSHRSASQHSKDIAHGNSVASYTKDTPNHSQLSATHGRNSTSTSHPSHGIPLGTSHAVNPHHFSRGVSASYQPQIADNLSAAVSGYEPRQNIIVPILPVNTPSNNPTEFAKRKRKRMLDSLAYDPSQPPPPKPLHKFEGPNIYLRCLLSLRSKVLAEQAFALTHLVRISFERGDKYKFDSFPGLSDGLIDKALEIGSIFYKVNWELTYNQHDSVENIHLLDAINGTSDILDRIPVLTPKDVSDDTIEARDLELLNNCTEAILTIRNMVLLPDNANYMSDSASLRDLLCIILSLPNLELLVEIKHYALDIAELITPNLVLASDHPLYISIVHQLQSSDRGMMLTALRALARISMNLETTNTLGGIPAETLRGIINWMFLNDEDLIDACLDFLYQYTAVAANVDALLAAINPESLVTHLVRLLAHGARKNSHTLALHPAIVQSPQSNVAPMPRDLLRKLLTMDEPHRCQAWLRGFFEEDSESVITQMTVWQAYQTAFAEPVKQSGRQMINPSDFIKYVSTVFPGAQAQIIKEQDGKKFVIRGIRPRPAPLGMDHRVYYPCQWVSRTQDDRTVVCGAAYNNADEMHRHILKYHFPTHEGTGGREPDLAKQVRCCWRRCGQFDGKPEDYKIVALHARVHASYRPPPPPLNAHIPASSSSAVASAPSPVVTSSGGGSSSGSSASNMAVKSYIIPATTITLQSEMTATTVDERNVTQAVGVPLSACLVLCNMARNLAKRKKNNGRHHAYNSDSSDDDYNDGREAASDEISSVPGGWNERLFRPVLPRLMEILTENAPLGQYISRLLVHADLS